MLVLTAACGDRTALLVAQTCGAPAPTCIVPNGSDPCGEASTVPPVCIERSLEWSCPAGSRPYARAASRTTTCRPFLGAHVGGLGAWGLSAILGVPTDDGRCLWIADQATLSDGTTARNVAFEPDSTVPFGTCPTESLIPPAPIVTVTEGDGPNVLVQLDSAFRLNGTTHVVYRIFQADPNALYDAVLVGGGVGRWDQASQKIVIPSAVAPFPWGTDLSLGDAAILAGDGVHAYVWGCARPGMTLLQGCELARLDPQDHIELWTGGTWLSSTNTALGAIVFSSGTWSSSVDATASGFRHIYAIDFGSTLESDTGSVVTGPWTSAGTLAQCDLPTADDPMSFCAGPKVHRELSDPTRPGEVAVTYGVGSASTTTPPGKPFDYWPRLTWVE